MNTCGMKLHGPRRLHREVPILPRLRRSKAHPWRGKATRWHLVIRRTSEADNDGPHSTSACTKLERPTVLVLASKFSIKEECLECLIPLGERHLRRIIADCVSHIDMA